VVSNLKTFYEILLNKLICCDINYNSIKIIEINFTKAEKEKFMLSKPQYLYQAKLIIDCFPKKDYDSIPKETLKYIEDNMKVDSNIVINPEISLEEQDIDPQTWEFLQKIADDVSDREFYEEYKKDIAQYLNLANEQNEGYKARVDNINLNKDVSKLQKENQKLPKAKELIYGYQKVISNKDEEIKKLEQECNSLKEMLNRIPKFIRMLFLRNKKVKLLEEKNSR
jgi:hypothetical protein